jgi:uncharacterized membrane-anchored protein YhcB (DUF1043 family)
MVSPVETQNPKRANILRKLPRLSNSVWILLIIVLVLIISIPMITSYLDQASQQGALRENLFKLQSQYAGLKQQLASQGDITAEISRLKSDADSARRIYGTACDSIETSQQLMDLSWKWDITITTVTTSATVSKILDRDDYPGTTYVLGMKGQVANFQNYLIELGEKFPSSKIENINILPSSTQGTLDTAIMNIVIICHQ